MQDSQARDIRALLAKRRHTTKDHVFDQGRIDLRPIDQCAQNPRGEMYGSDRIKQFARGQGGRVPGALISGCLAELASFRVGAPVGDDLTLMAIRRTS